MAAAKDRFHSAGWFELIVERIPDALLMADRDGRIVFVNQKVEVLFGYARSELIGRPLELLVPPRFRARHLDDVAGFFSEPKARLMGAGRELTGLRKDGIEVPIEIGLSPIDTAEGMFTLASLIDITQRITARKRAEEVEQQMSALVESADDAILTKSLDGIIRSWNPGAERLLGYRADDIIGQSGTRLIPADRQNEESMILGQIQKGHRVAHFETVRRKSDGSLIEVSLTISPIRDRLGSVIGASKIMRDITQRKRTEEELRRSNDELAKINADLEEFVYTASHDLRAPLTGVATVAQWILTDDDSLGAESRERLTLIQGRIERMKRLLNDIRDYARTGRYAQTSGPALTAAQLVADVVGTSHVPPGFLVRSDPCLDDIRVERIPLEQVLHNLINNAVKHHDRRAGVVTVSAVANGPMWRFSVTDDGPGVPVEYRETVFEMFKTLKPKDEVEGSGMGLALVRRVVERLGGRCGLGPIDGGRGAHVWFDWPLAGHFAREPE
jgi:two-component system sensor kinase FixL